MLALLPVDVFNRTLRALRIPRDGGEERGLTAVETIQVAIRWRVARQRQGGPAIDPFATRWRSLITKQWYCFKESAGMLQELHSIMASMGMAKRDPLKGSEQKWCLSIVGK